MLCSHSFFRLTALVLVFLVGCAVGTKKVFVKDMGRSFKPGTILSAKDGRLITFEQLVSELKKARLVFVGERHTNPAHHNIQLEIIRKLYKAQPNLKVGMEMFDHTYQPVLDKWSEGKLTEEAFLEQTHWYANWKFDYDLYRSILAFIKEKNIPVIGLNIPFHIPSKIAVGGLQSLSQYEKRQLPEKINTGVKAHREYIKKIFEKHSLKGRDFENFYVTQCVWEDAMAEAVICHLGDSSMVVLSGNGHIVKKFGMPERVYSRKPVPFKTVYLASANTDIELSYADYIMVTPAPKQPLHRMAGH